MGIPTSITARSENDASELEADINYRDIRFPSLLGRLRKQSLGGEEQAGW